MTASPDLLGLRLRAQLIERPGRSAGLDAASVVARLCAMQAQDYLGALWSVGLRAGPGTTDADVERAIAERRIVRTWPMRGTLHFIDPADVRWMLDLLAPRMRSLWAGRHRQLDLAEPDFDRARAIFAESLTGGRVGTRVEMLAALEDGGVSTAGQRGYHLLVGLAQRGQLCLGPMAGKQQTFVLLDEWVPPADEPPLERPAALARLAERYLRAHGPASVADLAWWAGLTKADARAAIELAGAHLQRLTTSTAEYWLGAAEAPARVRTRASATSARVHLLPGFDEYFLGYTDRSLQLGKHHETYATTISANGVFWSTFVIGGEVAGTWRRKLRSRCVDVTTRPFRPLTTAEQAGLADAVERYARFLGLSANLKV